MTVHRRVHDFPLTMLCNKAEPKVNVVQRSDMAQDLAKRAAGADQTISVHSRETLVFELNDGLLRTGSSVMVFKNSATGESLTAEVEDVPIHYFRVGTQPIQE